MISRFLTGDMCHAEFHPLGKAALSMRLDDTYLISEVLQKELLPWFKKIRFERQGKEESSRCWLWEQDSRWAAQSPAFLQAGRSPEWLGLTSELILLWAGLLIVLPAWIFLAPYDPTFYFTPSSKRYLISRISISPAERRTALQRQNFLSRDSQLKLIDLHWGFLEGYVYLFAELRMW